VWYFTDDVFRQKSSPPKSSESKSSEPKSSESRREFVNHLATSKEYILAASRELIKES
jgi:hypothetical protein